MTRPDLDSEIVEAIFALLDRRRGDVTICPSEVARAMHAEEPDWRAAMPHIRQVAGALASRGLLRVTRRGEQVDATSEGGPIRLGRAAIDASATRAPQLAGRRSPGRKTT